jgi:hypothetical protein
LTTASLALLASLTLTAQPPGGSDRPPSPTNSATPPKADAFQPDPSWKPLGPSLWFDPADRRLVIRARVVLREGPLEHLLCLKGTKEHEAILSTPASPRQIHAGLLLTGAEPGHPVRFLPKFEPPAGTAVAIELEWKEGDTTRRADARQWVFDERDKKPLDKDWVFAGSELIKDPTSKEPYYTADDGDLITVANFASAILDLPFASTANDADRAFVAHTKLIPPRGTGVTMYLRPRSRTPAAKPAR